MHEVQMLADSLLVPECVYRPRSFSGLMTLYESNHLKFLQLIQGRLPQRAQSLSTVIDDCDLHLDILARERYTSTLKLTYWFSNDSSGCTPDPDMLVRVYHDAALAEAVGGREGHRHHLLRALAASHSGELDRRWRANIMLNKWLDYLLDKGHRFG
jgi:uncharacterized protein YqiB (DUF1249 family)